jgi:hypothetical protein
LVVRNAMSIIVVQNGLLTLSQHHQKSLTMKQLKPMFFLTQIKERIYDALPSHGVKQT